MLRHCQMCELRCGANRLAGERGLCGLSADTFAYKRYVSADEEPEILPALRVFFGGCNMRCLFCDEAPDAFAPEAGELVDPAALACKMSAAVRRGVRSISILGGEPSLHAHTLVAIAAAAPQPLPIALNTNMYMTPPVLALLVDVVRWYLADLKFGNDHCAQHIAKIENYSAVVRRNIRLATTQTDVIVRHVLLPGHLDCCFRPLVAWLSDTLPGIRFQLYPGYVPCGRASKDAKLGRLNTRHAVEAAEDILKHSTLAWCSPATSVQSGPASRLRHPTATASITIGADGQLYCHDLAPQLVPVLAALCPDDPVLAARAGLCVKLSKEQA